MPTVFNVIPLPAFTTGQVYVELILLPDGKVVIRPSADRSQLPPLWTTWVRELILRQASQTRTRAKLVFIVDITDDRVYVTCPSGQDQAVSVAMAAAQQLRPLPALPLKRLRYDGNNRFETGWYATHVDIRYLDPYSRADLKQVNAAANEVYRLAQAIKCPRDCRLEVTTGIVGPGRAGAILYLRRDVRSRRRQSDMAKLVELYYLLAYDAQLQLA